MFLFKLGKLKEMMFLFFICACVASFCSDVFGRTYLWQNVKHKWFFGFSRSFSERRFWSSKEVNESCVVSR